MQPGGLDAPVSRNSLAVLSDMLSLPEGPSNEPLGKRTTSWPPSTPGGDLAHGPLLSPRDSRGWALSSALGTPASASSPLHSPLGSALPPVLEGAADGAGSSADVGGGPPSCAYWRSFLPKGLPPLAQGRKVCSTNSQYTTCPAYFCIEGL